jgi:betaine-homocysteine S-methyltransferase
MNARPSLLERLQTGIVIGAEGYLFEMERRGYLKAGAYVPEVVLDHPEALKQFDLPAVVMLASIDEITRDGYTYAETCRRLEQDGADVVGLNCTRGPNTMLPIIEQIRDAVQGYVAAVPVTYRTTPDQPIFQALREPGKERAFPIELDPFEHTRSEMAEFAERCQEIGVNYIGTCCGAGPHHVRAIAEALGRTVPASRYSPDLSQHPMIGKNVSGHNKSFLSRWKD